MLLGDCSSRLLSRRSTRKLGNMHRFVGVPITGMVRFFCLVGALVRTVMDNVDRTDIKLIRTPHDPKSALFCRLVGYLIFILLFYGIVSLETDVSFQYAVETGLRAFVDSVSGTWQNFTAATSDGGHACSFGFQGMFLGLRWYKLSSSELSKRIIWFTYSSFCGVGIDRGSDSLDCLLISTDPRHTRRAT